MTSTGATLTAMQQTRPITAADAPLLAQAPDGMVPNLNVVSGVLSERNGRLLGRRFVCLVPHVEGAWQLPEADVPAMEAMLDSQLTAMGLAGVMRAAPVHEDLTGLGYEPLPLLLWIKRPAAGPRVEVP